MDITLFTSVEDIADLVQAFEQHTLPRHQWTHAAHLTVALWYLVHHPAPEATTLIRSGIQAYNRALGIQVTKTGGYHETLTLFWIRMVRRYVSGHSGTLLELANHLIPSHGRSLPFDYYSRDRLMSWEARQIWVEPDLQPID